MINAEELGQELQVLLAAPEITQDLAECGACFGDDLAALLMGLALVCALFALLAPLADWLDRHFH